MENITEDYMEIVDNDFDGVLDDEEQPTPKKDIVKIPTYSNGHPRESKIVYDAPMGSRWKCGTVWHEYVEPVERTKRQQRIRLFYCGETGKDLGPCANCSEVLRRRCTEQVMSGNMLACERPLDFEEIGWTPQDVEERLIRNGKFKCIPKIEKPKDKRKASVRNLSLWSDLDL